MKYQVEVDRERCIACGNCYSTDPAHFESGDEGKSKVVGGPATANQLAVLTTTGLQMPKLQLKLARCRP